MISPQDIARFWSMVAKGAPGECWEWRGSRQRKGYGQIWCGPRKLRAHRISLELHLGRELKEGKEGEWVLHTCDNPGCVNPRHLYIGTPADNRTFTPLGLAVRKIYLRGDQQP